MTIKLTGFLDVPEDRRAEVLAALPQHISLTRAEPGCLAFNVDQCPDVDGRLLVSELFTDQSAFEAHQTRTKASAWAETTKNIARHYEISEVCE